MAQADRLLIRAGVGQPFVLHVDGRRNYKNFATLVDAVGSLQPNWPGLRLVVVGDEDRSTPDDVADLNGHGIAWLGFVSRPILGALYRRAAATASASLVEGFGLPVAEALALGCPIACSDIPAYRDAQLAAVALERALRSPRLSSKWQRTWDESTSELVGAINDAVKSKGAVPLTTG